MQNSCLEQAIVKDVVFLQVVLGSINQSFFSLFESLY